MIQYFMGNLLPPRLLHFHRSLFHQLVVIHILDQRRLLFLLQLVRESLFVHLFDFRESTHLHLVPSFYLVLQQLHFLQHA